MKILIVDDSKAMRMIVKRTLRQAGFGGHDIKEGVNGKDALSIMEDWTPDLVLSDWNMPEMNGLELLQSIRKEGIPLKFGFVTTEGTAAMRTTAITAGARFLITKPFTARTFETELARYLD